MESVFHDAGPFGLLVLVEVLGGFALLWREHRTVADRRYPGAHAGLVALVLGTGLLAAHVGLTQLYGALSDTITRVPALDAGFSVPMVFRGFSVALTPLLIGGVGLAAWSAAVPWVARRRSALARAVPAALAVRWMTATAAVTGLLGAAVGAGVAHQLGGRLWEGVPVGDALVQVHAATWATVGAWLGGATVCAGGLLLGMGLHAGRRAA